MAFKVIIQTKNIGHYKWNEYITEKDWSYLQSSASFSILLYYRCIIIQLVQIVHQKNSYVFILFLFFSKILEKRISTLNLLKKKQIINQIKKGLQLEQRRTPTFLFDFILSKRLEKRTLTLNLLKKIIIIIGVAWDFILFYIWQQPGA